MKPILRILAILFVIAIILCAMSYLTDKNNYGQWKIKRETPAGQISWIPFTWSNDKLGDKLYEKTAMFIPARIEGLPYAFRFQFDLGASISMVYEHPLEALYNAHPELNHSVRNLKSPLQFWNRNRSYKDMTLKMGDYVLMTDNCYVKKDFGTVEESFTTHQINMGSIGADVFANKVLIIDYPGMRFCILDSMPDTFQGDFSDFEINNSNQVLLPVEYQGKKYRALFDNGSSLFSLLTPGSRIGTLTKNPDIDSIPISSWGVEHVVKGRKLEDPVKLGGREFSNAMIYAENRNGIDRTYEKGGYDFIAGNALFWNNTIIIDFKGKKFGVR